MKSFILILSVLFVTGCTDADRGKVAAIGSEGHIECWSAGVKYYDGYSTGVVHTEEETDGWYFVEKESGHFVRISGPCVIRQNQLKN